VDVVDSALELVDAVAAGDDDTEDEHDWFPPTGTCTGY
jgi:hypothetical protein